jgi:hypothetical protein
MRRCEDHFLTKFGIRKVAEQKLQTFLCSVAKHAADFAAAAAAPTREEKRSAAAAAAAAGDAGGRVERAHAALRDVCGRYDLS